MGDGIGDGDALQARRTLERVITDSGDGLAVDRCGDGDARGASP